MGAIEGREKNGTKGIILAFWMSLKIDRGNRKWMKLGNF